MYIPSFFAREVGYKCVNRHSNQQNDAIVQISLVMLNKTWQTHYLDTTLGLNTHSKCKLMYPLLANKPLLNHCSNYWHIKTSTMADLNQVKRQDGGGRRFQKPLTPPPPMGTPLLASLVGSLLTDGYMLLTWRACKAEDFTLNSCI